MCQDSSLNYACSLPQFIQHLHLSRVDSFGFTASLVFACYSKASLIVCSYVCDIGPNFKFDVAEVCGAVKSAAHTLKLQQTFSKSLRGRKCIQIH